MWALLRISWREVTEGLSRFLLTMLSVALGVAFLTGTLTLRDSLQSTFDTIIGLSTRANVFVVGQRLSESLGSSIRRSLPLDYEYKIRHALGSGALVEPGISTQNAQIEDGSGKAIDNAGAPTIVRPYYDDDRWGKLVNGRWPYGQHEVVLFENVLEANDLHVGDTTTLTINGGSRKVRITGALEAIDPTFGSVIVLMERDVIEPLTIPDNKVPSFEVYLEPGQDVTTAIQTVAKTIPADAIVMSADYYAQDRFKALETGLGFVSVFLMVFVFLSIFIGSFVIANTFAMVVRQRMKQFAMLRAIGAKPGSIFGLVIGQAVVIGILGSVLGIALGIALTVGIGALFSSLNIEIAMNTMTLEIMGIGLITGMIVTIVGALLSARSAALTDPLEVLRNASGVQEQVVTWVNWVFCAVMFAGAGTAYVGAITPEPKTVGYGAVLVLFGVLGALRIAAVPIVQVVAKPFHNLWPVHTRLAVGNIVRNPKRTASTAGALLIGVALVITGATLSTSLKQGSTQVLESNTNFDLVVYTGSGAPVPRSEAEKIADVEGISQSSWLYLSNMAITRDSDTVSSLTMMVSPDVTNFRTQKVLDGDPDALAQGDVLINVLRGDKDAWNVGDELTVATRLGEKKAKVGALVEAPALFSEVVVPDTWVEELFGQNAQPIAVDIIVDDDADLLQVQRDINAQFVDNAIYHAATREEIGGEDSAQIDLILSILYALLALSIITSVFGIINTLALSVMERVREIGMIRAIGMNRVGIMGMIALESVLTTIFGTIIGLGVGIGLSWALVSSLSGLGISRTVYPWVPIVWMIIGSLVIGVLAAIVPARQAANINELEAMAE
ncbi:ABC transporter permease [Stomatohabitans albus]|uniref:ABC transporter permease n=1 Tax=Stomatohabitans albus TaxID=3110766 RepID=UPI00300C04E6